MQERIKMLREQLGYSQEFFAKEVGLTKNYISLVENGKRTFAERTLKDICRKFNVNESWLRTGEGKMFIEVLPEDEYSRATTELSLNNDLFIKEFVIDYWKSSDEEKTLLKNWILNLANAIKKERE